MNILVTTPYFYPHTGGSQRYIEELYSHLQKIDNSISVDILTYDTDGAGSYEDYRGFKVYRLPCIELLPGQFAIPNYFSLFKLIKTLRGNQYDLINAHTRFFDNSWWTPWLGKRLGAKVLFTDHTASHPAHPNPLVRAVTIAIDNLSLPYLNAVYPRATAVSRATSNFIRQKGFSKPIKVIHGGVTVADFSTKNNKKLLIKGLEKKKNDIWVTFVGRMIPAKGPQRLLEAITPLLKENSKVHVVFAGGGELLEKIKKHQSDQVHVLGNLSSDQIPNLLSSSDILVHPSTHHEGLPITLLEAGAAGCAVIATDRGGVTEVIKHNKTGLIVKPEVDSIRIAIKKLVDSKKTREELGRSLNELIKVEFDWPVIAKEYHSFLTTYLN